MLVLLGASLAQSASTEPWPKADLISASDLAAKLKTAHDGPVVLFVGFPVLYRGKHIPHAMMAGPASKPEGLELLKRGVLKLAKDDEIVIYCGCCPFGKCPNVRPAYRELKKLGFERVRVLEIPENFHTDWVAKGFPAESEPGAAK